MELFLLTLLYLCGFFLILAVSIICGFLILPKLKGEWLSDILWGILLRYGVGLSLLSALVIWSGLLGLLRRWFLLPIVGAMTAWGIYRAISFGSLHILITLFARKRIAWINKDVPGRMQKVALGVAGIWTLLLSLNILIGAMVPDFGQDAMWYHLAVPGQWALSGRADTLPSVMPSNYALTMEALYAGLLLIGDEILCSLLYAQVTLALLWGLVIVALRFVNWRPGFIIAAAVMTFFATLCAIAPIGAGNDALSSLMLLLAFVILINGFRGDGHLLSTSYGFLAGFLLGTASAAKLVSIGYCALIMFFYLVGGIFSRQKFSQYVRLIIILIAGVLAAYLPWAIRGWRGSGNPVFPLAANIFHIQSEYKDALISSGHLNSLYPVSWSGFKEALEKGLRGKILFAMTGLDVLFGLVFISALFALTRKEIFWRIQGLLLLSFYGVFFLMKGANEVTRYFSICYPLAMPATVLMFREIFERLKPSLRGLLLAVLLGSAVFTYTKRELQVASFPTNQWRFHPVLTERQRRNYAAHAETGMLYLGFRQIQSLVRKDTYIFLPDCNYPYYLKRRCLWWDEVCGAKWRKSWKEKGTMEVYDFLSHNKFDYILLTQDGQDSRLEQLKTAGVLQCIPIAHPPASHWYLYEISEHILAKFQGKIR